MHKPITQLMRVFGIASLLALAACGDTAVEQALMGGGAGAAGALVLDGNVATGAVVGAAANFAYCQKYPSRC
ncbi:hypothetical protein NOI20_02055 [Rhodobacteraceae bacterium 10Alg 79]|uniref:Lipoprotein n=2 Tax=Rhodalgimonas zhirmunskyi TaxID=2964767 RepID=A0AAJ1X4U6_9RHOB|nr:hypothetical protein [Rhodoalgimonas zhirmunskyi]